MNSQTDTSATSRAKHILNTLDEMQERGSTDSEQFHFVHSSEEEPLEGALADMLTRVNRLASLANAVSQMELTWADSQLPEEARDVGVRFLRHMQGIVDEQREIVGTSDIHLLSRLWEWGPDIRHVFPGLTAWTGPVPKVEDGGARERIAALQRQVDSLLHESRAQTEKLEEKETKPEPEPAEVPTPTLTVSASTDAGSPGMPLVPQEEVEREKVVARVGSPPGWHLELDPGVPLTVPDLLTARAWTDALNEVTGTNWTLETAEGNKSRTALLWSRGDRPEWGAKLEMLASPGGMVLVLLRVEREELERASTSATPAQVEEMHRDPLSFVKTLWKEY